MQSICSSPPRPLPRRRRVSTAACRRDDAALGWRHKAACQTGITASQSKRLFTSTHTHLGLTHTLGSAPQEGHQSRTHTHRRTQGTFTCRNMHTHSHRCGGDTRTRSRNTQRAFTARLIFKKMRRLAS